MIKINNISFSYDSDKSILNVLDDISLFLKNGETVSILGPSGCGKSTLLRCISGFLIPSNGEIYINGETPYFARKNKKIGFAFQEPALINWLNIEKNIIFSEKIGKSMLSNTQIQERSRFLLELVELSKFKKYYPDQLSGGMKQRVSLARALFTQPEILLLDEPFAALDLLTRTQLAINLRQMIKEVNTPTILVTHSIEEAVIFSNRIIILSALPAKVNEVIDTNLDIVNIKSLEDVKFLSVVAKCRSLLLMETKNKI
jgi:NitT/TauT family transport system ATP-binding protein